MGALLFNVTTAGLMVLMFKAGLALIGPGTVGRRRLPWAAAGLTAIAAPVRNAEGTVIASVSASGPSFRIPATRIPALAAAVRRAADEVSGRLGWIVR